MSKTTLFYIALIVLIVGALVLVRATSDGKQSKVSTFYDEFATCLADAGAVYYGAFWCPNCKNQSALFENSRAIPYVECSTPDGQGQVKQCIDEGITGYPTWRFVDGSELSGTRELEELAEKTGCTLPTRS